jgi:alanine dehydrogenase
LIRKSKIMPLKIIQASTQSSKKKPSKRLAVVVRETLHGEARVSVTPADVNILVSSGKWAVRVERDAGALSGFTASDYEAAGAEVYGNGNSETEAHFEGLFDRASVVCRCKRATREREILEGKHYPHGVFLLGFLYLLNDTTPHVKEWLLRTKKEKMIDLTQTALPISHPGNAISPMSELTGGLAVDDVLYMENLHSKGGEGPIVIVGAFGVVGKAALLRLAELKKMGKLGSTRKIYLCGREVTQSDLAARFSKEMGFSETGASVTLANTDEFMGTTLRSLHSAGEPPSIVLSTARIPGKKSGRLIKQEHFPLFADGCVFLDLAITEGGSVEHALGDVTIAYNCSSQTKRQISFSSEAGQQANNDEILSDSGSLANIRFVHSVTGYPKRVPREASTKYSKVMLHYLQNPPICEEEQEQEQEQAETEEADETEDHEGRPRKVQKVDATTPAPCLTGTWAVSGQSASSGFFQYVMSLVEGDQGEVRGEVKKQDMTIDGRIDHGTGVFSFTQMMDEKVNTCTATLSAEKNKVVLTGQYTSSTGGTGSFKGIKKKSR